jgi:hypothetical protein
MKGQAWTYAEILIVLILSSIALVKINATGEVRRAIASSEGKLINFENYAELLIKTFNQSIEFISQRAAYDLGKTGGIEGSEIATWNQTYPTTDIFKNQLEEKIKENLPKGTIENGRTVSWGDASIDVDDTTCGPIESSKCFLVEGNKSFSIYDKSIDSRITVNHKINHSISSSYFKLLSIGRKILENNSYYSLLISNTTQLKNKLSNDFNIFSSFDFSGDYIYVSLTDVYCSFANEYYCLAPLKPEEIVSLPYDFITLNFKVYAPSLGSVIEVYAYENSAEVPAIVKVISEGFYEKADINSDGFIDSSDLLEIVKYYDQTVPPAPPEVDVNGDNKIGLVDIVTIGKYFGKKAFTRTTYFKIVVDPGNYILNATYNGINKAQSITVNAGETKTITFNFP